MRIDNVENIWNNLEDNYCSSGMKSRRKFVEKLVGFNGTKGAVQALIAQLKTDLDSSADTIERYNALCNLLSTSEQWLLDNTSEIADFGNWMMELAGDNIIDFSRLSTVYKPKAAKKLLHGVNLGYVLPGCYDGVGTMTFAVPLDKYVFFSNVTEFRAGLRVLVSQSSSQDALFEQEMVHILNKLYSTGNLRFPCVFVAESLVHSDIVRFKSKHLYKVEDVPILPDCKTTVSVNCDCGLIELSSATSISACILKGV